MRIFLEAFVDTNFGDDLFIHIVTSRYAEHTFYMLIKEGSEDSYRLLKEHTDNLCLLTDKRELRQMDAMLIVGGDMFWNYGDYSGLLQRIRMVKKNGGWVAFLGFSLFPEYAKKTLFDLRVLFAQADVLVTREETSYQQLNEIVPWQQAEVATDMAFTTDVGRLRTLPTAEGVLGISVRKKIQEPAQDTYAEYCRSIADTAAAYLAENSGRRVVFLAMATGTCNDEQVAEDIMALCPQCCRERMDCVSYGGDVQTYLEQIQRCEMLVCTRFHGLVFALLLNKPFLPVIYEAKMERLLQAVGYHGIRLRYETCWAAEEAMKALNADRLQTSAAGAVTLPVNCRENMCDEKAWKAYLSRSSVFFDKIDVYMRAKKVEAMRDKRAFLLYNAYVCKEKILYGPHRDWIRRVVKRIGKRTLR